MRTPHPAPPRPLRELISPESQPLLTGPVPDVRVTGVTADSRQVRPGDLFVATAGLRSDGHRYLAEARARGAAAAVVERSDAALPPVPTLVVRDCRRMLAAVASAWFGHPARAVPLVGITGTLGKTSTLRHLETLLRSAVREPGTVGSIGVRAGGAGLAVTGFTVPDPLRLHHALHELVARRCDLIAMEATTHAMTQGRLLGVEFAAGVFTGLVLLEHIDYHGSFRAYVEAKLRFFDHLRPGAPLVYRADDRALRAIVSERAVRAVGCGTSEGAAVRFSIGEVSPSGSRLALRVAPGVPRLDGSEAGPLELAVHTPLIGRPAAANAALAAAMAVVLGADAAALRAGLERLVPAPRRTQTVRTEPFILLDDYGGHPDILSNAFGVVRTLPWKRLHVVSGYRGQRGAELNRMAAQTLAIWLGQTGYATVRLTRSVETADEGSLATDAELNAFQTALRRAGIRFAEEDRLDRALAGVLDDVRPGDLLLLLGSREMDDASALLEQMLRAREEWPAPSQRSTS